MTRTRGRWIAFVAGYATMAFGVIGLVRMVPLRAAGQISLWVVGADLLHDLVLAPLVCVFGVALAHVVSPAWRWPVRAGAIATALVLLTAYPALRGFGRHTAPGNGSVLPLDYTTAVLTVLAVIWGVVIGWCVVNAVTRQRAR